ncbi:MAG TPA: terminase small subunit [Candidatus Angelobacter sp.]|jgi:phage terminase small subunit|nr:terminase small subunit [Candidatus Angelobacter sp.]
MNTQSSNTSDFLSSKQLKFVAAWQGNDIAAARAAGYRKPKNVAFRLMQNPAVATEIRRKQRIMTEESAKRIAAQLSFDRNHVLNRLWEMAQISPEKTNNTLSSQVKAAESLAALFDAELKRIAEILPHLSGKSAEDVQFWIRHGHFPSESGESQ